MTSLDPPALAAARGGDQAAFERLVEPYRHELLLHCYRFFGSVDDAEDMLQETWLRAWRRLSTFAERSTLRAWLYKIATNVCLDALASRRRRRLPPDVTGPADPTAALPAPLDEPIWLQPLPDELLGPADADPETVVEARESVSLAFLALLQHLPGRQRAVLILRDVLGFSAGETAQILEISSVAVNSALQRARKTMSERRSWRGKGAALAPASAQTAELLARYVQAWEAEDAGKLVTLLREDIILTMPPLPAWYQGPAAVAGFLDRQLFRPGGAQRFRLQTTRANGGPAFGVYQRDESEAYRPAALHVLTLAQGQVAEIHDFLLFHDAPQLFARFGLPPALS